MHPMHPTVLLVDDDPHVTAGLARALHHLPLAIRCTASGAEALRVLEAEPVHVLVADEKMPGMSGSELLAVARRRWPETIRIILTGHTADELPHQAAGEGDVWRFFTKPGEVEALAAAIQAALASLEPPTTNGAVPPAAAVPRRSA